MTRFSAASALVIVDPQKAFVDERGSLARAFGWSDIQPNVQALDRLVKVIAEQRDAGTRIVLVRSEYGIGQFADGQLDRPLSHVCVPGANVDCEWADRLVVSAADTVITKTGADACSADAYRALLDTFVHDGIRIVYFAGFQLTTCVKATAISSARSLGSRGVRSVVLTTLSGARASSHLSLANSPSRVEMTCAELTAAGVEVVAAIPDLSAGPSAADR